MWGALELVGSRIGSNARTLVIPDSVDLGRLFEPFEGQASNPRSVGAPRGDSWVPPTFGICKTRGLAVGPAHESLINNPRESREPVAPTLAEWASRPLVGNRTLRGSGFLSLMLGPLEGHPYLVRDRAI
jgi:hypothetical protein